MRYWAELYPEETRKLIYENRHQDRSWRRSLGRELHWWMMITDGAEEAQGGEDKEQIEDEEALR
jgi:hypothetical protein